MPQPRTRVPRAKVLDIKPPASPFVDIDELLNDRRETVVTIYSPDKKRHVDIKLAYKPGALTGRILRAFRETDDSATDIDQTTAIFLETVLIEWNLADKKTGGQLGTTYADIEAQRLEVLVPIMQHIANEMFAEVNMNGAVNPK